MRAVLLALMLIGGAVAQTAIVLQSAVCPAGQITIATQTATLGASAIVKLSCAKLDATVTLDATTTPPTVKAKPGQSTGGAPVPLMVLIPGSFSAQPDGVTKVFSIPNARAYSILLIYDNGKLLNPLLDYTLQQQDAALQVTFTTAPAAGDVFQIFYYQLQFSPGAGLMFVCVEGVCEYAHESTSAKVTINLTHP